MSHDLNHEPIKWKAEENTNGTDLRPALVLMKCLHFALIKWVSAVE